MNRIPQHAFKISTEVFGIAALNTSGSSSMPLKKRVETFLSTKGKRLDVFKKHCKKEKLSDSETLDTFLASVLLSICNRTVAELYYMNNLEGFIVTFNITKDLVKMLKNQSPVGTNFTVIYKNKKIIICTTASEADVFMLKIALKGITEKTINLSEIKEIITTFYNSFDNTSLI